MTKEINSRTDMPNLRNKYKDMVVPAMMKQFNYKNVMQVPKVTHVSVNMGIGDAKDNPKKLESAINELTLISAQKPVVTKSRKDISNFKIILKSAFFAFVCCNAAFSSSNFTFSVSSLA